MEISLEARVPPDHPLRAFQRILDRALEQFSPRFPGRDPNSVEIPIDTAKLARALLLQLLYTIRTDRQLLEHLNFNLLFRWFVGLGMDAVWSAALFAERRDRWLASGPAPELFDAVLLEATREGLLGDALFTLDASLLESWTIHKNFSEATRSSKSSGD